MRAITAEHGLDALNKIADQTPDILFTDLNMPVMDGWALIDNIRQDPTFSELPIVVLSTETRPVLRARAIARGASGYLTKPVRAPKVLAETKRLLAL